MPARIRQTPPAVAARDRTAPEAPISRLMRIFTLGVVEPSDMPDAFSRLDAEGKRESSAHRAAPAARRRRRTAGRSRSNRGLFPRWNRSRHIL